MYFNILINNKGFMTMYKCIGQGIKSYPITIEADLQRLSHRYISIYQYTRSLIFIIGLEALIAKYNYPRGFLSFW